MEGYCNIGTPFVRACKGSGRRRRRRRRSSRSRRRSSRSRRIRRRSSIHQKYTVSFQT
jgi:hypothetical protein